MDVSGLAARYLAAMHPAQQDGACLLGGVGVTGVLAHELGLKLQSAGKDVRSLSTMSQNAN